MVGLLERFRKTREVPTFEPGDLAFLTGGNYPLYGRIITTKEYQERSRRRRVSYGFTEQDVERGRAVYFLMNDESHDGTPEIIDKKWLQKVDAQEAIKEITQRYEDKKSRLENEIASLNDSLKKLPQRMQKEISFIRGSTEEA